MIGGIAILLIFAKSNVLFLWVGFVIVGAGTSSTVPTMLVYVESKMKLTNTICGIILFLAGLTSWVLPILIGSFIDRMPMFLIYLGLVLVSVEIIFFVMLYFYTKNIVREKESLSEAT